MRRTAVVLVALAGLTWPSSITAPGADGHSYLVGPADSRELVRATLVLRTSGQHELERLIASGRTLPPTAIGVRYGLTRMRLRRLRRQLARRGLRVERVYRHRGAARVRGSVAAMAKTFGVEFYNYLGPLSDRYRNAVGEPVVPPELRRSVRAVASLSTQNWASSLAVQRRGLQPIDAARAYGVEPLWQRGFRGRGESIAVVSFARVRDEDVALFDLRTGLRGGRPIEHVPLFGGTKELHVEAALDVEVIRSVAPEAQIIVYETKLDHFPGRFGDVINEIVEDRRAQVVSVSYGRCDDTRYLARGDRLNGEEALRLAAASGVSVFIASGDQGAYDCQGHDWGDLRLSTSWPGNSPSAVSVGGTRLSLNPDGTYRSEAGWEDILSTWGSGGGLNRLESRPTWQVAPGVDNASSNGRRQLPDVAAAADPDSPFFVVYRGQEQAAGGTSAAAPYWAAVYALSRQYARTRGAGEPGYANPLLYAVARTHPEVFNDVTQGGNRFYRARPGWDYVTGLGSPNAALLAQAVSDYVLERGRRRRSRPD
jgi:kumamolisin